MTKNGHSQTMNVNPKDIVGSASHKGNLARFGMIAGTVLSLIQHADREGNAHTTREIIETVPLFPAAYVRQAIRILEKQGAIRKWKRGHWRPTVENPSSGEFLHGKHASADQRIAAKEALESAAAFYGREDLVTKPRKLRRFKMPNAFVDIGDAVAIEYDSDKFDGVQRIYRHESESKRKALMSTDGSVMIFQPPFKLTERGIEG